MKKLIVASLFALAAMAQAAPADDAPAADCEGVKMATGAKGKGYSIINGQRFDWKERDIFCVPSWAWHQFRADENEVFGFLCLVKVERDRPTLPTPAELAEMKSNPEVAAFIRY